MNRQFFAFLTELCIAYQEEREAKMPILAIDPGGTIGWCYVDTQHETWSGTIAAHGVWRPELQKLFEVAHVERVVLVVEDIEPRILTEYQTHRSWEKLISTFYDTIQMAREFGIKTIRVRPRDWMEATIGDPMRTKKRASRLVGQKINTEHEADAICMAYWQLEREARG